MNHPLPWRASHAVHATRDVGLHLLVEGGSLLAIKFLITLRVRENRGRLFSESVFRGFA